MREQPLTHNSISWCMSTKVNFALLLTLLKSFFRYSAMLSIALSRGTDGCKLTTSYGTWISVGIFSMLFASLRDSMESLTLCWLLFSVGWITLTRYLEFPEGGVPIVDTTIRMGLFFSGLWALNVWYNCDGIWSEGYISKYFLSVNFFSFLNLNKCFWILLV